MSDRLDLKGIILVESSSQFSLGFRWDLKLVWTWWVSPGLAIENLNTAP